MIYKNSRIALTMLALLVCVPAIADSANPQPGGTPANSGAAAERDERSEVLVYSVNRTPEPTFDTARAVQVLTREDIWRKGPRTLPELLMEEVGIFVQQTNYGGGSPIIRGLMGKQILILVDGVRLNNATYRFGPIQYLNTIDVSAVERIEIVRGAGSALGSDALGGMINIITRRGPQGGEHDPVQGSISGRYSSADAGYSTHVEASGQGDRYRYVAGATYRASSDLEGGGDVGEQVATGYDEAGANLGLDVFFGPDRALTLSYLGLEQNDVPRTDRVAAGNNLVFDFDPQRLQLLRLSYQDLTERRWAESLQLNVYWNLQEEGRQEIRSSRPTEERRLDDSQRMVGLTVEAGSFVGSHRLVYGIDYSTEDIESRRIDVKLQTGAETAKRGNYTDGSSYDLFAAYVHDRFNLGRMLTVSLGTRYSTFSADGSEDSALGSLDLASSDSSLTGSLGLVFHATPSLNVIAEVIRGFRAPNIDDISVFDERSNGTEVPSRDLRPEEISTYELGLKYSGSRLAGSAFYYRSDLQDLLVRTGGTIDGLSFFDLDGDGEQDANEPSVLKKANIGAATIEGFELDFNYAASAAFDVFGNYSDTRGTDQRDDVPLGRIPPAFGTLGLRWSAIAGRHPWAELAYHFAGAQRRLSPGDVSDSRIGPDGTDGFNVLHLRSGLSFNERFRASLAIENLTDEQYKVHSSGIWRPGRQAVAQLEWRF